MSTCIKVLVVDDEAEFLDLFSKRFTMRGLEVFSSDSGKAALAVLKASPIDVVVLDIRMPGMSGIETLKEIRKLHPTVEVILLTGHGSVESGLQGMSLGAYDYVMKPFKIEDLFERISKANERRQLNLRQGD